MEKIIDKRIKTFIIDSDPRFVTICSLLISDNGNFNIVGTASILKINEVLINADLLIVDVTNLTPEEYDILFVIKKMSKAKVGVLAISSIINTTYLKYFKIGLVGFINKSCFNIVEELSKSLCDIYEDRVALSKDVTKLIVDSFHRSKSQSPLTDKETEIIYQASKGKTYASIANDLNIKIETTKSHFRNIYQKLGVNSKYEAISLAAHNRWV